ncbi:armadillo-type protein [Suillus placidus]|uniref:Armadillo-type protein n=1 Tax=Suillus placidus TaxID=48579 RepID=A0A9P6ZMG7_9AGAM|nr:armadillo-type protein [Suillus placidus]
MPARNKQHKMLLHFYWEQHPNEYIRGATLRFLQKISKDTELLEPLIPTRCSCLEHRHPYVRKNAVSAVYTIYRELLSPQNLMRCAFVFLAHCAMPKAVERLISVYDQLTSLNELLQMSILEVRLDCKNSTAHQPRYIRCMFELLNSSSHAVKYEAAMSSPQNPAAVKAAALCFVNLAIKEFSNVKLIVLDRLDTLCSRHGHILDGRLAGLVKV